LCRYFIVRRLKRDSIQARTSTEFLEDLVRILNIPDEVKVNEAERDYIITEANRTLSGVYNLLGSGDVHLSPVDWHADFKTEFRWPPGTFYKKYEQVDLGNNADVKVPRELSRGHHLLRLGLAYRLTANPEYANLCISEIDRWIDENPLMYSINWGCAMDVAIRAVNWMWAIGFIASYDGLEERILNKMNRSLYEHGWFIWRNQEKNLRYSGNHYLSDLVGLIHLGLLFGAKGESRQWIMKGSEELFHEMRLEILPSGMSYERSTNYNRLVLELFMVPIILLRHNNFELPSDIWYRLGTMFEFVMFTLKPDGTTPVIGDQDNGRLLPFNKPETINLRYLLSVGALLFDRSDLKSHSEGFNVYCSLFGGENAYERWGSIPVIEFNLESKFFSDIGLYVMRRDDNYLLLNATGRGLYPEVTAGSHTHSDLLSFELFTHDKSFLVDPGSYVYSADADQRLLFRSTKMHNTVVIDGKSQDELKREKIWSYDRDAIPGIKKWESNSNTEMVIAYHNGYSRLKNPVLHQRTVIFDKRNIQWKFTDAFLGKGVHTLEWFFHFDAGIDFIFQHNTVLTICGDNKNIELIFMPGESLELRKETSYISKSYGVKEMGYVLIATMVAPLPLEFNIEINKVI